MSRMTFAEGVSAQNLLNDLSTQFLGAVIGRIDTAHITLTAKGRSKASIRGEFYGVTFDKIKTPVINEGVLFNPPLLERLRVFFAENDCPAYVSEKGEVSKTAPATMITDKVQSKEELLAEKTSIRVNYASLKGKAKAAADARLASIEALLKNA